MLSEYIDQGLWSKARSNPYGEHLWNRTTTITWDAPRSIGPVPTNRMPKARLSKLEHRRKAREIQFGREWQKKAASTSAWVREMDREEIAIKFERQNNAWQTLSDWRYIV